jgi:hypothetical protein
VTKNDWLLVVFGCYVGAIPVFGAIYFYLYRKQPSRFVFAGHIRESRIATLKAEADNRIMELDLQKDSHAIVDAT